MDHALRTAVTCSICAPAQLRSIQRIVARGVRTNLESATRQGRVYVHIGCPGVLIRPEPVIERIAIDQKAVQKADPHHKPCDLPNAGTHTHQPLQLRRLESNSGSSGYGQGSYGQGVVRAVRDGASKVCMGRLKSTRAKPSGEGTQERCTGASRNAELSLCVVQWSDLSTSEPAMHLALSPEP